MTTFPTVQLIILALFIGGNVAYSLSVRPYTPMTQARLKLLCFLLVGVGIIVLAAYLLWQSVVILFFSATMALTW